MVLLTETSGTITPQGIIIIVVMAAVIIWALIHDKKKKDNFFTDIEAKYKDKIIESVYDAFLTTDGEFFVKYNTGTVGGYKVFKLGEIAYVFSGRDIVNRVWTFSVLNSEKKLMKGEYLCSSGKVPLMVKNAVALVVNENVAEAYCALLMKHGQNIQRFEKNK